jgi:hypothetical protein
MSDRLALMLEFPNLASAGGFEITSPKEKRYNCIAYAARDEKRWWWPDAMNVGYWPPGFPRETTLDSFVAVFQSLGFQPCENGEIETGYEKIAIYTKPAGTVTHAARQFPDGSWRSKLGPDHDISHAVNGLDCKNYGSMRVFLKRPT